MKHPFDNSRVSRETPTESPIIGILEVTSEVGEVLDNEGNPHLVPISKTTVLSFSDNIPKDIDADSLSMENCLKNNYNLNEVTGFSSSEESPESASSLVDFEKLSNVVNPKHELSEEPTSETNENNNI